MNVQIRDIFVRHLLSIVYRAEDKFNAYSWRTFGHQVTAIGQSVYNAGGDSLMRDVLLALEERLELEFPDEADSLIGSLDHQWHGIGGWVS